MAKDLLEGLDISSQEGRSGPRDVLAGVDLQNPGDKRAGQGGGSSTSFMDAMLSADDFVRGVADTFTFGLSDEIAAGANTATGLGDGTYEENLSTERARDAAGGTARTVGQVTGALTGAFGLGKAGVTLLRGAQPTVKSMAARGGAEGAIYGAAYGAGSAEGGPQARAEGALWGSLLGVLTGAGTGAVAGKMAQGARPAVPGAKDLKKAGNKAYDSAFSSGVVIKPDVYDNLVDDLYRTAKTHGSSAKLDPKVYGALDEFEAARGSTPTLQDMDLLRRSLKRAAGSNDKAERALAQKLVEQMDDRLRTMTPADVAAGNVTEATKALDAARGYWTRGSKGEVIDGLIRRAEKRSSQFSGSGFENALRTEFRSLAMNDKKMRLFTPQEQRAIELVSEGGTVANALRFVGKAAPRGVVSGGFHLGVGAAVDPTLGFATMGLGELGRLGATVATKGAARSASEVARAGGALPAIPKPTQAQLRTLEAALLSQSQQNVNALDQLRTPSTAR